ncbi:MAG: class I SAM-dependent methyltransferase [Rhodobacteraceae bacterium]|nr:class I SAM-dependent methyltransferase [Paracoccaceae bacterium]
MKSDNGKAASVKSRTFDGVSKNDLGFFQVDVKPSEKELQDYYASKYYQEAKGSYELEYSKEELQHFRTKLEQRWSVVRDRFSQPGLMLDVGCGEGYALSFFDELGWDVKGLDFSSQGILSKNPHCAEKFVAGDVFQLLDKEREMGASYDVVWLQNVLEHVIDPVGLMKTLHGLMKPEGVLIVTVPNDFSNLQFAAMDQGHIDRSFWVALPDHLSYFSLESLKNIGTATGWRSLEVLGDFPIDWFLFHPASNYVQDPSAGKPAHHARVAIENLIGERPMADIVSFYSALAKIGMGRDLTIFYTLEHNN